MRISKGTTLKYFEGWKVETRAHCRESGNMSMRAHNEPMMVMKCHVSSAQEV
jgi:hypothetical protein